MHTNRMQKGKKNHSWISQINLYLIRSYFGQINSMFEN